MIVSAPLAAAHTTSHPRRRTATGRQTGLAWALWNLLVWRLFGLLNSAPERRHRALARTGLREPCPHTAPEHDTAHPPLSRRPLGPAEHAERTAALARAVDGARRARTEAAAWA